MNTRVLALLVPALWASAALAQDSPEAIIESIAHTGKPVPGVSGATFGWLGIPQIDAEGSVSFLGWMTGPGIDSSNDLALFFGPPGDVQIVMRESDPAPDLPGITIAELSYAGESLSETGWFALTAEVAGPGIEEDVNDRVLYVGPPGDLRKVIQAGDEPPGCEGMYLASYPFGGRLSDNGTLFVGGSLGSPDDHAFWIGSRDNLELVVREGTAVPGEPDVTFEQVSSGSVHTDSGEIVFAPILGGAVPLGCDSLWQGGPGTLQNISREGAPVAGMPEGTIWDALIGWPTTNASGDLAQEALISGPGITDDNDDTLFLGNRADLVLVVQEGDPAPEIGPGVEIAFVTACKVNSRREAFYCVKYRGDGITDSNKWAMYFGPFGEARLTLRDADPAPTFPPEITLSWVAIAAQFAMNDVGDLVTQTEIQGPGVTDDDKAVLWFRHHVLQRWIPLLRANSSIAGRTLSVPDASDFDNAYSSGTGGADGLPQGFNDLAMLAMVLEFTDASQGVHRISPPAFGDGDQDGDVDLADWWLMEGCSTGPDGGLAPDCALFDLDWDGDVDLDDHRFFQQLFQGS